MAQSLLDTTLVQGEEHLKKGDKQSALSTFHEGIMNRKKGSIPTTDKIMQHHVELCVELHNIKFLKEALLIFRNLTQNVDPQSLQSVLEKLRESSEKQLKNIGTQELQVHDLEAQEEPESLLLSCLKPQKQEETSNSFKFLWEVYKLLLDILKTNGKMVSAYKDTAQAALGFCSTHRRKQECKRLCETLRSHLQTLIKTYKSAGTQLDYYINLEEEETLGHLIALREKQIQVCIELDLWQEAFKATEDLHQLMQYRKNPPAMQARYWNYLSKILWKGGHYFHHAYSLFLNLNINKKSNKSFTQEQEKRLSSQVVLAVMAVPTFDLAEDIYSTLRISSDQKNFYNKLSTMISTTGILNREQLIEQLHLKKVIDACDEEVRQLFQLLENRFLPLRLSEETQPLIEKLKKDEEYSVYLENIEYLLVGRVLGQLSKCYSSIKFEAFQKLLDFLPFSKLESYIVEITNNSNLKIQIDYKNSVLRFKPPSEELSLTQKLSKVKKCLQECYNNIRQKELKEKQTAETQAWLKESLKKDKEALQQEFEKSSKDKKQAEEEKQRKEEEKRMIKEQEEMQLTQEKKKKKIEEIKDREISSIEKQKRVIILEDIMNMISKMQNLGFSEKEISIDKKKLSAMDDQELLVLGPEKVHELYVKLMDKAKREREKLLEEEQKKLEYWERAKRETLIPVLKQQWEENTEEEIRLKKQKYQERFEKDLALKQQLSKILPFKNELVLREENKAKEVYEKAYNDWKENLKSAYKAEIVEFAKKQKKIDKERKEEEERRRKEDEERRAKADREQETARFERKPMEARAWRKDDAPSIRKTEGTLGVFRSSDVPAAPVASSGPPKKFVNSRKKESEEPKSLIQRPEERKISEPSSLNFRANPPSQSAKAEPQRPGLQRPGLQRPQETKFGLRRKETEESKKPKIKGQKTVETEEGFMEVRRN